MKKVEKGRKIEEIRIREGNKEKVGGIGRRERFSRVWGRAWALVLV